ncbi:MAG: outer membrane protein assembly factor BamA [Methylococcales bacterium]|nr:outer membrane protein assembly factor BamA [Methylococcales bacterium]
MNKRQNRLLLLACIGLSAPVAADDSFIVDNIQVNGLQRISAGTVFNYLGVSTGDRFGTEKAPDAIRALFKTGFFQDVRLGRDGNTLIIQVEERPAIAKILFEGNNDISSDDLKKALEGIGLAEGKTFNRQLLEKVEQELSRQYFSHGKYGLKINTEVSELTRNRVGINIKISEGKVAKIKEINLIGNNSYDTEILLGAFELSTSNLLSFYTQDDQYSKQKLSADLERLKSYYLDRGYINFQVDSTQVAISPDKKEIYITVNISEGEVFNLNEVKVTGNLIIEAEELTKLVRVGPGEIFSRKNATETSKAISDRLGEEGYVFANVNMVPEIDEAKKTVDMTFFVDPGKRVYVNRINIKGNTKTRDEVVRREFRQMESSWASTADIERSKARLERLGYFEEVNVETPKVPGTTDQIDVNYSVVEKPSGNLTAGLGFSQTQGVIINANISQDNIFGTGKRLNLAFNNSDIFTTYRFGLFDPYYTLDGISLGYDLSYQSTDAQSANISRFNSDEARVGVNFGIPLNEFDRLQFSLDLKYTSLDASDLSPTEIIDFIDEEGNDFLVLMPSIAWSHDTLNRAIFPTSGGQQRLSAQATVPGSDLEYFKINYRHQQYFPLARDLTLRLNADVAYGDGYGDSNRLPFFEHFFAGGVRSVRGFQDNTLGPRDSTNRPFGGATKIVGSAEVFFPVPFIKDLKSMRMGAFVDAGTVSDEFNLDGMRYSAGISGEWLSPFGAIAVSIAQPFNADQNDEEQVFQFSFGSGF